MHGWIKINNNDELIAEEDREGVYFFFFRNGCDLLERTNYYSLDPAPLLSVDRGTLCYIGSSQTVRKRMRAHVRGDSRCSTLRLTIASIMADDLKLEGWSTGLARACHFGPLGEDALTNWFESHSIVRFISTTESAELETKLIKGLRPPFNISVQKSGAYAKHLMSLRSRFGFFADLPQGGRRGRLLH